MDLVTQLKRDEDLRLTVYDDATGKPIVKGTLVLGNPTIGIGRNLSGKGITGDEAVYLVSNDIAEVKIEVGIALPWTSNLDLVRLAVLLNMAFNMGIAKLLGFKNTLSLIQQGKYASASAEMLDSAWARQVGARATRLSIQLATGIWQ